MCAVKCSVDFKLTVRQARVLDGGHQQLRRNALAPTRLFHVAVVNDVGPVFVAHNPAENLVKVVRAAGYDRVVRV